MHVRQNRDRHVYLSSAKAAHLATANCSSKHEHRHGHGHGRGSGNDPWASQDLGLGLSHAMDVPKAMASVISAGIGPKSMGEYYEPMNTSEVAVVYRYSCTSLGTLLVVTGE